jgi:hypothetical protein
MSPETPSRASPRARDPTPRSSGVTPLIRPSVTPTWSSFPSCLRGRLGGSQHSSRCHRAIVPGVGARLGSRVAASTRTPVSVILYLFGQGTSPQGLGKLQYRLVRPIRTFDVVDLSHKA